MAGFTSSVLGVVALLSGSASVLAQPPPEAGGGSDRASDSLPRVAARIEQVRIEPAGSPVEPIQRLLLQRSGVARRCIAETAQELPHDGVLEIVFDVGVDGRPAGPVHVRDRGRAIPATPAACLAEGYVRRIRFPPGTALRVTVQLRYELPDRPTDDAVATTEAQTATDEARSVRARGRCLVQAATRLEAAANALRTARGAARARARERLRAARAQLASCEGLERALRESSDQGAGLQPDRRGLLGPQ